MLRQQQYINLYQLADYRRDEQFGAEKRVLNFVARKQFERVFFGFGTGNNIENRIV